MGITHTDEGITLSARLTDDGSGARITFYGRHGTRREAATAARRLLALNDDARRLRYAYAAVVGGTDDVPITVYGYALI